MPISLPVRIAARRHDASKASMPWPWTVTAEGRGRFLPAKADAVVFIDHDLSWEPQDLVRLIETEGDPQPAITVEVSGDDQVLEELSLRLLGDVCAGP